MKKKAGILTVFFVVLALGAGNLRAEIIEINITAEIAYIGDLDGLLNGQLGVGDILSGSYIYDSATPDSQPSAPAVGDYWHYSSPYGISLSGGGFTFQTDPDNVEFIVEIVNNNPYDDGYLLLSYNNLPLYDNVSVGHISWQLDDSTGTALSSDALPTTPPVLEDWDLDWGIRIRGGIPDEEGKFIERFIISAFVTSVELVPYQPKTYYVNATDGSDDNDGLTPETAFATIQKAIDSSFDGDTVIVADGTYTGPGNRDIDFLGKAIAVRSESGPENCIIDCNGTEAEHHRGFYFNGGEDKNSIIDGLTVANGYGPGEDVENRWILRGGAILCSASSPTIINCTIKGNLGDDRGGGICCTDGSNPTIKNCTITDNFAEYGGGIYCNASSSPIITNCTITGNKGPGCYGICSFGGGIYCRDSNPLITKCTISSNRADCGGGISCYGSSPTITHCTTIGNSASHHGGGIYCEATSSPIITNCTISGNTSGWGWVGSGGGILCYNSSPTITNATITGNSGPWGGGFHLYASNTAITNCTITDNVAGHSGGGINSLHSNTTLSNCIFWANEAPDGSQMHLEDNSNVSVSYTDVKVDQNDVYIGPDCTLNWGLGNIDADPYFVEPGYWDANDFWIEGDYHLLPDSPCIDTGDPNYIAEPNKTDLDGNPRVSGDAVDMGAYETIIHEARLLILPRVINRKSNKPRIMAWIHLLQGITKDQIDSDTALVLYPGGIKAMRQFVFDNRRRGTVSIFGVFDKAELIDAIPANGRVELQVLGQLLQLGQYYSGYDTIRIIGGSSIPQLQRKQIVLRRGK